MDDWTQHLQSVSPFHDFLDISLEDTGEDYAICTLPIHEKLFHAGGMLHGGVSYALADTAVAMALMARLGTDRSLSTIEGKINYLAPVPEGQTGELSARADLKHVGSSTAVATTEVTGPSDTTVALGLFTYAIR